MIPTKNARQAGPSTTRIACARAPAGQFGSARRASRTNLGHPCAASIAWCTISRSAWRARPRSLGQRGLGRAAREPRRGDQLRRPVQQVMRILEERAARSGLAAGGLISARPCSAVPGAGTPPTSPSSRLRSGASPCSLDEHRVDVVLVQRPARRAGRGSAPPFWLGQDLGLEPGHEGARRIRPDARFPPPEVSRAQPAAARAHQGAQAARAHCRHASGNRCPGRGALSASARPRAELVADARREASRCGVTGREFR